MALIDLAKQKWQSKATQMANNWVKGFSDPAAGQAYDEGMSAFLGMSIAGSGPSQAYKAAQANAGQYAEKYRMKVNAAAGEKWARNLRRAFSR